MSSPTIVFDASDFERIAKAFESLPADMQKVAFRRAAARTRKVVERNYARFASLVLKVPQKAIMARINGRHFDGVIEVSVKSTNIPLHELNPQVRGYGVYVRGRKPYEGAFIPKRGSKKAGGLVLKRHGADRLPTHMVFGPNPANAIDRKPADYEDLLAEIAAGEFAKVLLQQVGYLLDRVG